MNEYDQLALRAAIEALSADSGTIHRMGADGMLHLSAIVGDYPPPVMEAIRCIPVGKGLAGLAAERREPVTVCNLQQDGSGQAKPGARATGMEGAITVPCIGSAGAVLGVLGVASHAPRTFSPAEVQALLSFGRAIADAAPGT